MYGGAWLSGARRLWHGRARQTAPPPPCPSARSCSRAWERAGAAGLASGLPHGVGVGWGHKGAGVTVCVCVCVARTTLLCVCSVQNSCMCVAPRPLWCASALCVCVCSTQNLALRESVCVCVLQSPASFSAAWEIINALTPPGQWGGGETQDTRTRTLGHWILPAPGCGPET